MNIIVEVGANNGNDTARFLESPENIVYCFEPTVELQLQLQQRFKNNENFHLIPAAVHIENGFQWFNIAGTADWGCSSLYEWTDDICQHIPDRPDFHFTDRYKVMTMRLDTFINLFNIPYINYLWIDAQGHDFNVLKSLGYKIDIVKEGKCEASIGNLELYKTNKGNDSAIIKEWLENRGFQCTIDHWGAEVDVHFKNTKV